MGRFSDIMSHMACKLGKNIVQTRRALYDKAFGQTYADRAALGRPLQRVSELFREYVLVHSMLSFHEYLAYQCLQFLERQAIPAEKGNAARIEAPGSRSSAGVRIPDGRTHGVSPRCWSCSRPGRR